MGTIIKQTLYLVQYIYSMLFSILIKYVVILVLGLRTDAQLRFTLNLLLEFNKYREIPKPS